MNLLTVDVKLMALRAFGVLAKDGLLNLTVLLTNLNNTEKNVNGVGTKMLMSYNAIYGVWLSEIFNFDSLESKVIGLSIHYDRYPNMQMGTVIMALCYPFMRYLALKKTKHKSEK